MPLLPAGPVFPGVPSSNTGDYQVIADTGSYLIERDSRGLISNQRSWLILPNECDLDYAKEFKQSITRFVIEDCERKFAFSYSIKFRFSNTWTNTQSNAAAGYLRERLNNLANNSRFWYGFTSSHNSVDYSSIWRR